MVDHVKALEKLIAIVNVGVAARGRLYARERKANGEVVRTEAMMGGGKIE